MILVQRADRQNKPPQPSFPSLPCPSLLVGQTVSSRAMRQRQRPPSSKDDPRRPSVSCFLHLPLPLSLPREWPPVQCSFVCGVWCACVWHSTRRTASPATGLVCMAHGRPLLPPFPAFEPQPSRERPRCTETITKQKTQRPPLAKLTGFVARPGPTCAQDNGGTIIASAPSLHTAMHNHQHHHHQPRLVRNGGG